MDFDDYVRPAAWRNPAPAPRYDLVVIGGGTAGLVCAVGAAGLGARVALVERHRLGGDCLNTGCVPSKALLDAAAAGADFATAMRQVRDAWIAVAPHDSAARVTGLGIDLFFGDAHFTTPDQIAVDNQALRFRRAVVATGSRPTVPEMAGLSDRPYLTTDTIFELTSQPADLLILGGGAVGCELAQAFARLGTRVTLVERAPRLLPRDDADAAHIVARRLERDGVRVRTGTTLDRIPAEGDVLVATGRVPNVEALALDRAGISHERTGIVTDDRLRTTNRRVFAAGDVTGREAFTHAADAMARIVIQNALFFGRKRISDVAIPSCIFTSPEVAQVGNTADDAITVSLSEVDRALIDAETDGFVRIHHRRGRITGGTIVAPRAGELIAIVGALMQQGGTLAELSAAVFPYPTFALALKRAGDVYQRSRVTPLVSRALRYYFRR